MRRSWRLATVLAGAWLVFSFLLTSTSLLAADDGAENQDNIDLAEITRRLTEWRISFVNLRVVWELRRLPKTDEAVVDWPAPPDPAAGSLFVRQEWIWADHGLDYFEIESSSDKDGGSKDRMIEGFNGPKGLVFQASFQKEPEKAEEFTDLLIRGATTSKPMSAKVRAPVTGLYWPGFAAWLPEMLSEWKWSLEGIEEVGGEPCARIAAAWPKIPGAVEVVWLDLNHDCLVRRKRRAPSPSMLGGDFIVDEFQQLEGGVWFPKRGRIQLGATPHENQMFIVTQAAVNQSLDLGRFEPPPPAVGTAVDDRGKVYKHGSPPANGRGASGLNAASGSPLHRPSAVPRSGNLFWWSASLVVGSVALLAAGFWISRRKQS